MRYFIVFISLFMLCFGAVQAQPGKKKHHGKDFRKIKSPVIKYKKKTATKKNNSKEKRNNETDDFTLGRIPSLVSEDTSSIKLGEPSLVEIDEEVRFDSAWIKTDQYYSVIDDDVYADDLRVSKFYSIWNTSSIDPYDIDAKSFNDTIPLLLYTPSKGLGWSVPLKGRVVVNSKFGFRWGRAHTGTDLDLNVGDTVLAAFDGVVRLTEYKASGYGNHIVIRHQNGLETLYGHLSKIGVKVGQYVKAGQMIGWGGNTGRSTGPHLHFETRFQGNPFNPEFIFDFEGKSIKYQTFNLMPQHFRYAQRARQTVWHKVRAGETLQKISRRYGVTAEELASINNVAPSSKLKPGRRIRIK